MISIMKTYLQARVGYIGYKRFHDKSSHQPMKSLLSLSTLIDKIFRENILTLFFYKQLMTLFME